MSDAGAQGRGPWPIRRLFDLCYFIPGKAHEPFIHPLGDYICVNSKFISTEGQVAKACNKNVTPARIGDILMVMSDLPNGRALAKCFLVGEDEKYAVNQRVCILRPKAGNDPQLLFHILNRNPYFLSFDDGVNQTHLLNPTFQKCEVAVPDNLPEQQAIAAALSDADGMVAGLERVIAKKRLIKQGAMQDLLTARRRLPGFSGEWEEATISEVAYVDPEALGAGTPKDYAFRYISLEDVNQGVLSGWTDVAFGSAPSRARRILQKDDVLLGTVRPNLKSHMLFDRLGADWVGSTGFAVLRSRPEKCISGYLFELIMSDVIGRQIDEVIAGSNYPAISNSDVRKLKVLLPSIEEQKAIAVVLRDMDAEIQTLESRLAKARAVKEGMMQNLLTGRVRLV